MVELYLSSALSLYGVMINRLDIGTTLIVHIFSVSLRFVEITKQNGGHVLQYRVMCTSLSRDLDTGFLGCDTVKSWRNVSLPCSE